MRKAFTRHANPMKNNLKMREIVLLLLPPIISSSSSPSSPTPRHTMQNPIPIPRYMMNVYANILPHPSLPSPPVPAPTPSNATAQHQQHNAPKDKSRKKQHAIQKIESGGGISQHKLLLHLHLYSTPAAALATPSPSVPDSAD
jgi:hypothetical protein